MTSIKEIEIGNRTVGPSHPPFVVAEMSGNHNQSLDRALEIIELAAKAGAHGVKLQTYTADTITLDVTENEFHIDDPNSLWRGSSLYELYQKAHTPWDWHEPLLKRCAELGLVGFSTPFDATAVDFLEDLNVPCHKIASFENADIPLIKKVAATGKPVFMSTGMATVAELDLSVKTLRENGCKDIILLKCTSSYPASPQHTNVRTIPHLSELFGVQVGLSDHTMGVGCAIAAVALGATMIEKHFTSSRADGGVDAAFSAEPDEMASLVIETERAWQSLGKVTYGVTDQEKRSLVFRRSLYVAQDIKAGETFDASNLRVVRPGLGLEPKFYEVLLGKQVNRDLKKGTPVSWEQID